jgi:hypothetical protein
MTNDTALVFNLLRANVWKPCDDDKAWGLVEIYCSLPEGWLLRKWKGHLSQLKKLGLYEAPTPGGCFGKVKL